MASCFFFSAGGVDGGVLLPLNGNELSLSIAVEPFSGRLLGGVFEGEGVRGGGVFGVGGM